MIWVFAIVIVLIMGAVAVVAAGRGDGLEPTYDDRPDVLVPTNRLLGAEDLRRIRFSITWRGYRPTDVDALLDRLAAELESRDAEVLGGGEPAPVPSPGPSDVPSDVPSDGPADDAATSDDH